MSNYSPVEQDLFDKIFFLEGDLKSTQDELNNSLSELEKQNVRIKNLQKAIKLIASNFPSEVLSDQLGEDYGKFKKLIGN